MELAAQVTSYDELGVDHQVDVVLLLGQGHRDGVDEEGHVVGDHLDDGVPAGDQPLTETLGVNTRTLAAPAAARRRAAAGP